MYENFLAYRRYFWGKLTLATTLVLVLSYIYYSRRVSPNGATLVGLIYGVLSFLAILLLMYYGMRKRSYTAKHWPLRAWLSFHVYIGTMTLILVPLHAGMKPPRSKLRGITRKGIVCETPRFLTLFPLQGNLGASSEESPDSNLVLTSIHSPMSY